MTSSPRHGGALLEGGSLEYKPDLDYFGQDSLTLTDVSSGRKLEVQLRIFPRYLPLAGRFQSSARARGAGLFDALSQTFTLCSPDVVPDQPMSCRKWPVAALDKVPYVPLAIPDRHGRDVPALFEIDSGLLLILAPTAAGDLRVDERHRLSRVAGGWPLIGEWDASGRPGLAVFFENGRVIQLGEGAWHGWPEPVPVPAGDNLAWPIQVPREGLGDAVGLADPDTGDINWLSYTESAGSVFGFADCLRGGDFRRPLTWVSPPEFLRDLGLEVFYLEESPEGSFELIAGRYRSGGPQTIPIKFPDDPPGG